MKKCLSVLFTLVMGSAAGAQSSNSVVGLIQSNCRVEIDTFCQGIAPGGGALLACLTQHQSELSVLCAEALKSLNSSN